MFFTWKKLEESFPSWEVHHTGGGIFVLRRDYSSLTGESVMVSISEDVALIMRDIQDRGCYISCEQYRQDEGAYWYNAFALEQTIIETAKEGAVYTNTALKVFPLPILDELAEMMRGMADIIWGTG